MSWLVKGLQGDKVIEFTCLIRVVTGMAYSLNPKP